MTTTFAQRVSMVLENSNLNQTEFAAKIPISQQYLSQICSGKKDPSDRVIKNICEEFDVNEDWLRYGKGSMKKPVNRNKEIENFMNEVLHMESEDFRRRLISVLTRLDEDEWELLESMALKLAEETEKGQKSFWPVDAGQAEAQPGSKIIKIAGRDGSLEEHALTDEELAEYQRQAEALPDAGGDL